MTASVVVVTYNSREGLERCLESIPQEAEVVLVDQGSTDDTLAIARRVTPRAVVISAGANRGFGAGCNLGAANATGDVVVFLNPDAAFRPGALEQLVAATARWGGGLVGPRIVDDAGADVTRCRHWSTPLRDLVALVIPQRLLLGDIGEDIPADRALYRVGGRVPVIQGSCMALGRDVFMSVDGFDERFFLYSEEEVLARRLGQRGLAVHLAPWAAVMHSGHLSTAAVAEFAVAQKFRSRALLYTVKYGALRGLAASSVLAGGALMLLVTAPLRERVGYRRAYTARWCRAALSGLGAGAVGRPVAPPPPAPASGPSGGCGRPDGHGLAGLAGLAGQEE